MRKLGNIGVLFFMVIGAENLFGQNMLSLNDSLIHYISLQEKKWTLSGFITSLTTFSKNKIIDRSSTLQLFHNRLKFRWKFFSNWDFNAEGRTRLYIGKLVAERPHLDWIQSGSNFLNLEKSWWKSGQFVLHTNMERLSLAWRKGKWSVRAGRQRINWGVATVWNPNDLFNSYNFLDVDYEERPGADAIQFSRKTGALSSLEFAIAGAHSRKSIASFRYFFNHRSYDWQLLGGSYLGRPSLGVGWAGKISEAGFKGELQYYFKGGAVSSKFNATLELDYLKRKSWYCMVGLLINSQGIFRPVADWNLVSFKLSPENMMPGKWSFILTCRKQWQQLWSGSFGIVYSPGIQLVILLPSVSYNLSDRVDVDLTSQLFSGKRGEKLHSVSRTFFVRVKYSF